MTPKLEVTLTRDEMGELLDDLGSVSIYRLGCVQKPGALSKEEFLEAYADGKCYALTLIPVQTVEVDPERVIYKPAYPVVQVRKQEGLEISLPLFYEDPITRKMCRVTPDMPNSELFKKIRRWIRRRRHAH